MDGIALDHLVSSKSVLENSFQDVKHHVKSFFEVRLEPRLVFKNGVDHLRDELLVARAVNRSYVENLCHIKDAVNDIAVKIKREVFCFALHILG